MHSGSWFSKRTCTVQRYVQANRQTDKQINEDPKKIIYSTRNLSNICVGREKITRKCIFFVLFPFVYFLLIFFFHLRINAFRSFDFLILQFVTRGLISSKLCDILQVVNWLSFWRILLLEPKHVQLWSQQYHRYVQMCMRCNLVKELVEREIVGERVKVKGWGWGWGWGWVRE